MRESRMRSPAICGAGLRQRVPGLGQGLTELVRLVRGEVADHPFLQLPHGFGEAVEQLAAGVGQQDQQLPAIARIALPAHESAVLQGSDEIGDGLRGDEGVTGQLSRGEAVVSLQDGERGVLECGDSGRSDQLVQMGADDQLHLLDHVQQGRGCLRRVGADQGFSHGFTLEH
jgi:hypothetical protein